MKHRRLIPALAIVAGLGLARIVAAQGQWAPFGPPAGALSALTVAPDGTLFLVARTSGVHRSGDRGRTWSRAAAGIGGAPVGTVAGDPGHGTLYASTQSALYRSADGGASWQAIASLPRSAAPLGADVLALAGGRTATLYLARATTLLRVVAGRHGTAVSRVFEAAAPIVSLAVDPNRPASVFAGTMAPYGQNAALYHSADGGVSWSALAAADPLAPGRNAFDDGVRELAAAPSVPAALFALTAKGLGLYRSLDAGASWEPAGPLPPESEGAVFSVAVARQPPFVVSVIGDLPPVEGAARAALFASADGAASWRRADRGGVPFGSLRVHPATGELFALSVDGVARGGPGGLWRQQPVGDQFFGAGVPHGPPVLRTSAAGRLLAVSGDRLFASDDGGLSWSAGAVALSAAGISVADVAPDRERAETLYAATTNGLLRSSDGGLTWQTLLDVAPPGTMAPFSVVEVLPDGAILAVGGVGIYRSADSGATWQLTLSPDIAGLGSDTDIGVERLVVSPAQPAWVYAETFLVVGHRSPQTIVTVFQSRDGGQTWRELLLPSQALLVAPDRGDPRTLYVLASTGLFKSTNAGRTWQQISAFASYDGDLVVDPLAPATLWAARADGVWRSRDGGSTWRPLRAGLAGRPAFSLFPSVLRQPAMGEMTVASDELFEGVFP